MFEDGSAGVGPTVLSPRPCQVVGHLFEGGADSSVMVDACTDHMANHLEHLADWSNQKWNVGDYNRYTVTACIDDSRELVLTLSSEPQEDVRCRIVVGTGSNNGEIVDRSRRERLQRYGFALVDEKRGWEHELRISSRHDAESVARDLMALLTEVFGYNGRTALSYALTKAQRGEPGFIYRVICPDDLRKMLLGWGYQAAIGTTVSGNPVIRSGTGGYKFHVLFAWPTKDATSFGCLDFVTVFTSKQNLTLSVVNEISRSSRFCRLYLDDEGDLILERDVSVTGGATADYIHECLLDWACMMDSVVKKLDALLAMPTTLVH
ncbi:MAG: YbjN domain-containing protein [Rhodospirillaceae bacterium]